MNDDYFFNLNGREKEEDAPTSSSDNPVIAAPIPIPKLNAVIERKIMTLTTFRIYPNGEMSHPVSKSWFQDAYGTLVPKKKEKKKIEVKKSILQKEEMY